MKNWYEDQQQLGFNALLVLKFVINLKNEVSELITSLLILESATYDKLASEIFNVMVAYEIGGKVTYIVTDNGSNFVKAFREFGTTEDDSESEAEDEEDDLATRLLQENDENEEISSVSAGDLLDCFDQNFDEDDNSIPLVLPRHLR